MEQRTPPEYEAWEPWESPYEQQQGPFTDPRMPGSGGPRIPRWDLRPIFMLLDALRRGLPGELQAQFTALLREFLLTLRSLIDWYLERLDGGPQRGPDVEDIPIR